MPTKKKRVAVMLNDRAYEAVSKLAAVEGCSMSKLIAKLVEPNADSLNILAEELERLKNAPDEARTGFYDAVSGALDQLGDDISVLRNEAAQMKIPA